MQPQLSNSIDLPPVQLPRSTDGFDNSVEPDDLSVAPGGPPPPYVNNLAVLAGGSPNGSWDLFVLDDNSACCLGFSIDSGWALTLEVEPPPPEPPPPTPSNQFTIGGLDGRKLSVDVASAGTVSIDDAGSKDRLKESAVTGGPGTVEVTVKLTKPAKRIVRREGKVKVQAEVTFAPNGGDRGDAIDEAEGSRLMRARPLALALAIALAIGWTATASAATIVVDVTNDAADGSFDDTGCTLREAVQSANTNAPGANCNADTAGADTIVLEAGLTYKLTNHAAPESANVSGDLDITGGGGTTIRSAGPGQATIDADSVLFPGDDAFRGRAIEILDGAGAVTLQRVRIINGSVVENDARDSGGGGIKTRVPLTLIDSEVSGNSVARFGGNPGFGGGGILVGQGGALTMTGSTVAGNSVQGDAVVVQGGGITFGGGGSIGGSMTATNSTISGNIAAADSDTTEARGAGIVYDSRESTMALTNVTINRNSATGPGTAHSGGIFLGAPGATIRGSILAGNQARLQLDCGQQLPDRDLVSLGGNVLGPSMTANCGTVAASDDVDGVFNPNIALLGDFGGPTPTQLPNPGSPAIDRGGVCPETDQRGLFRAPAAPCDAGAVEVGATTTLPPPPPPPPPAPPSNDISFGAVTRDKNKGTATLAVSVPGAGELALAGDGLKAATATATGPGEVALSVKAAGKAKRQLRRKGKKTLRPSVTFTPAGGTANTESTSVKLVRR